MSNLVSVFTQTISLLTIFAQGLALVILLNLVLSGGKNALAKFFSKNGILFAFIVATVATLGSLFYSEVAHYQPCELCWFQRIFMYPQTILLAIAWKKKYAGIALYSLVLSIIGGSISAYHYLMQLGAVPSLPCAAVGISVSCSQRFVLTYGYITIPMMALSAFVLIAAIFINKMVVERQK